MTVKEAKAKLIALARAQVGYHEIGDNWTKYAADPQISRLYGWNVQNQPWCCTFVNWCFLTAFGYDVGAGMTYGGTAACANSAALFRAAGAYVQSPEPGDQIFFYSGGGINHTGIVIEVNGSAIRTVEGNYSDKVGIGTYILGASIIAGFGRPKWALAEKLPADAQEAAAGSSGDPILRKGSRGDLVKDLQQCLIDLGFDCGPDGADGKFGNNTAAALQRFQSSKGLPVTGEADEATQNAIRAAFSGSEQPTPAAAAPAVSTDDHGLSLQDLAYSSLFSADTVLLQAILTKRNFSPGKIDGYFGPGTQSAVNQARNYYGLELTGTCDAALWAKLLKIDSDGRS